MIPMPAFRIAARVFAVGSTAARVIEMLISARSNIPPLAPKSFCMSTTSAAVLAVSMVIGSGFASTETIRLPLAGAGVPVSMVFAFLVAPNASAERRRPLGQDLTYQSRRCPLHSDVRPHLREHTLALAGCCL